MRPARSRTAAHADAMVAVKAASAATPVGTRGTASAERVRKATSAESTRYVVSVAHTSVLMPHADPAFLRGAQDCASNACGRSQWGSTDLSCQDSVFTCAFQDYAFGTQPDGSACRCDGSCQSGFCRDTGGSLRDGKCGKGAFGDKCGLDTDCASGACGRPNWGSTDLSCQNSIFLCAAHDYAYRSQSDGTSCLCDDNCESGYCSGGSCFTKRGWWQSCPSTRDSDCQGSLTCAQAAWNDGRYVCCGDSYWDSYSRDTCKSGPWETCDGDLAANDRSCTTNVCAKRSKDDETYICCYDSYVPFGWTSEVCE